MASTLIVQPDVMAVEARGLTRWYGKGKKKVSVLRNMDLRCGVGQIYGLLGPSGCGKTTFLKCLMGFLGPHKGSIRVFGRSPGSPGHDVPGRAIGYMPQDLALYFEFTISEAMRYYARLYNMTEEEFVERKNFLLNFLDLPTDDRLVGNLSGGQKRRVSLAIALLHSPRLLILDEPTVGVDPVLRAKIWAFLVKLSEQGVSVIITTHYIEEARQADVVGFMRDGRLLDEGPPNEILARYQRESLEDAFLFLCQSANVDDDDETKSQPPGPDEPESRFQLKRRKTTSSSEREGLLTPLVGEDTMVDPAALVHEPEPELDEEPPAPGGVINSCKRCWPRNQMVKAELYKGTKRMLHNIAFMVFQFVLPSLQVILFCLAIGKNPDGINLSVVNQDVGANGLFLANGVLSSLDSGIVQKTYVSYQDAYDAARRGDTWGLVMFPPTFTNDLMERFIHGNNDPSVIAGGTMSVQLDMSNEQISLFLASSVQNAFEAMAKGFNATIELPIKQLDPVYGSLNPKFTDFIAPGMIVAIAFAGAIGLTSAVFVQEKRSGCLDRTWAAGVRPSEILFSQMVFQILILFIQLCLLLTFALVIFKLPMEGSLPLAMAMALLLGMTGMMAGMVISALSENEEQASQLAIGSFFPMLLLSGIIWPKEGVPMGLRYISYALPTTWSAEAIRSIMSRGWGMSYHDVWMGFTVTGAWVVFLFIVAVRGLKARN